MSLSDRATVTTLSITGDTPVFLVAIVNSESILSTLEHEENAIRIKIS